MIIADWYKEKQDAATCGGALTQYEKGVPEQK